MVKRIPIEISLDNQFTKIVIRIEGDNCPAIGPMSDVCKFSLLRNISDSPELTYCFVKSAEKIVIFYNGTCWCAEAEAIVENSKLKVARLI